LLVSPQSEELLGGVVRTASIIRGLPLKGVHENNYGKERTNFGGERKKKFKRLLWNSAKGEKKLPWG